MTVTRHAHCYSTLLRILPRPFREEFGYEMVCDFSDATERAVAAGSPLRMTVLWVNSVCDLLVNAVVHWLRTGIPMLTALSLSWTLLLFGLLAIQGIPQNRPEFADLHVTWLIAALTLLLISIACSRHYTRHL